jgi:iron complex outermembrane receptor protein
VFQTDWEAEKLGGTLRVSGYGDVLAAGATAATDLQLGDALVVDAEARYRFTDRVTLAVGADNLLDQYPRQSLRENNTTGAFPFSNFSPYGFNGRYVYGRISLKW